MGNREQRGIRELVTNQLQHLFLVLVVQGVKGLLQEYPLGPVEQQTHHAQSLLLPPFQGVAPLFPLIELIDQVFKARQTQRLLDLFLVKDPTGGWVADGVAQSPGGQMRPGRHEEETALAGEFNNAAAPGPYPGDGVEQFCPDEGIARDQYMFAFADLHVDVLSQNLPVVFDDTKIVEGQYRSIQALYLDPMVRLSKLLIYILQHLQETQNAFHRGTPFGDSAQVVDRPGESADHLLEGLGGLHQCAQGYFPQNIARGGN